MDIKRFGRPIPRFFILLAAFLLLASCGNAQEGANTPQAGSSLEVDPSLREFYRTLGGEVLLGPAISKTFSLKGLECQYTANSLICLDPARTGENRFGIYPLGKQLGLQQDPPQTGEDLDGRVVNGYSIYEEFIPVFDQLSGVKYAGAPLSQVQLNYAQQRYEQFFENIGLYRSLNDPPGTVRLLAYGAAACAEDCSYIPITASLMLGKSNEDFTQPFLEQIGEFNAAAILGAPLSQPYSASDGAKEQVYTNAVLFSPSGKGDDLQLRPLSRLLPLEHGTPGVQVYGNKDGMVFYPVKGDLGFHVPLVFDQFIAAHGGTKLSGQPIAEVSEVEAGLYRQCFENYCLEFHPNLPENEQVTLTALGKRYLENLQQNGSNQPLVLTADTVSISISEQNKTLDANSPQQIRMVLTNTQSGQAITGVEASLLLSLPGEENFSADFPPTNSDGESLINIPAMKDIANGTILTYTVCLKTVTESQVCATGNYLIWNTP